MRGLRIRDKKNYEKAKEMLNCRIQVASRQVPRVAYWQVPRHKACFRRGEF
jgi:hypothetical protein